MSVNKTEVSESDSDFGITEKLKSTGRISLSDITAATIGPLDAETWDADQSEDPNNDSSQSAVHRPWTDLTEPEKQAVSVTKTSSVSTVIVVDALQPASQSKRKFEQEDNNFQKRVRTDFQPMPTYENHNFQSGRRSNSKQFDFAALAQSINKPENYSALTSAIKTEPSIHSDGELSLIKPVSEYLGKSPMVQPWLQVKTDVGPYITSIPIGKFVNSRQGPSATFTNPDSAYNMSRFQPWVQGNPPLASYTPMTPIKTGTDMFEQESINNFNHSHSYSSPVNAQKVTDYNQSLNSPGLDSRFNDPLTNLLGSPQTASPISKNPFFSALQNVLESDCKKEIVPQTLMEAHFETAMKDNIFTRERKLHERFNALQETSPDEIRQLSGFYRYQSALIETERFRTLHECNYPLSYKDTVNKYYDDKLHTVMDRVEQSVILLESANKENKFTNKGGKPRPHLNKDAVKIMEDWYQQNLDHPYPTSAVYDILAIQGNVGVEQVKKWFANKRNRTHNTRTLTEIAMKKRKLNLLPSK